MHSGLDTVKLHEFVTIARLGSFSRAAEELNISQSSLSKHVLALERELGLPLFVRTSRSVALSSAGKSLLPLAEELCEKAGAFSAAAQDLVQRSHSTLRILSIPVMAQYGITDFLGKLRRGFPDVHLQITECEQQELNTRLHNGDFEFAFSRCTEPLGGDFSSILYARDHLVAVLPPNHPLAKGKTITAAQLENEPLLLMDHHTGLNELYGLLFSQTTRNPNVAYNGHRPENLLSLVAQGVGIALMMKGHADYYQLKDLVVREITPRVNGDIYLLYQKQSRLSPDIKALLDSIAALLPTK